MELIFETEAKKLVCPISIYTGKPEKCLGKKCIGWKTFLSINKTRAIADQVFIIGETYVKAETGEKETICHVIRAGQLIKEKWIDHGTETLFIVTHDEIMKEMNSHGGRMYLDMIRNRKPMKEEIINNTVRLRNIQYNTEDKKFYHIFDSPVEVNQGYCAVIYDK